jgi:hypothetical protein
MPVSRPAALNDIQRTQNRNTVYFFVVENEKCGYEEAIKFNSRDNLLRYSRSLD